MIKYWITLINTNVSKPTSFNSTYGFDADFDGAATRTTWTYETEVPVRVGEYISTDGFGMYEVRAILRQTSVQIDKHNPQPNEHFSNHATLKDSTRGVEDNHSMELLVRGVDINRVYGN